MKYKIKYQYQTGDSYSSEIKEDFLELTFENYENAVNNLNYIKQHYEQVKDLEGYTDVDLENGEILFNNSNKKWFVKKINKVAYKGNYSKYNLITVSDKNKDILEKEGYTIIEEIDEYVAKNSIILYADNGNQFKFSPPWCGYFESLKSIELVIDNLKYEF